MIRQFFSHLFPRSVSADSLSFSKTFYLGTLLTALFILLGGSGVLLMVYYSPEPSAAYRSILFLEERVAGGAFLRALHRMSSHMLLIIAALHLLRTVFTGAYAARRANWKLGYIVFFLLVFEAYTGYLMPLDQLSYWATKTGMELMNTLPFGEFFKRLLMPDDVGGRLTMLRFFALHVVMIPFVMTLLISAHLYNIRRDGGLVPARAGIGKVPAVRLINMSVLIGAAGALLAAVLCAVIPTPLELPADPFTPPNPAKSAWFLLWIQEVVSWRAVLFNGVAVLFIAGYFLPEMRKGFAPERASWFSRADVFVWSAFALFAVVIGVLTAVGLWFKGANWEFVSPFF